MVHLTHQLLAALVLLQSFYMLPVRHQLLLSHFHRSDLAIDHVNCSLLSSPYLLLHPALQVVVLLLTKLT